MKIKARYFEEGVSPQLLRNIDAACLSAVHPPAKFASEWELVKLLIWW